MAARFLVAGGTGNWNDVSNWSATTGGASGASFPVAGDTVAFDNNSGNAPMTVNTASACASIVMSGTYAGTLTFDATLSVTGTVTFLSTCTIAGTVGTLLGSGTTTWTSGGKTLTGNLTVGTGGATLTLGDNWVVNGLVTLQPPAVINGFKITCAGGVRRLNVTNNISGTTKLVLTGGTWDDAGGGGTGGITTDLDLQGNVTVSGTVNWGTSGKTLKYVSGTITTTSSTLYAVASGTFDTAGVAWNNVTLGASGAYSLSSALAWGGTLIIGNGMTFSGAGALSGTGAVTVVAGTTTLNNTGGLVTTGTLSLPDGAATFAGSSGFTVGTLTTATLTASRIHTLTFGNTYAVTTAFGNVGATATVRQAIKSSSAGNKVALTLSPGATLGLVCCDPTDVDSSAGATVVSLGGVITNTDNWSGSIVAGAGGARILRSSIIEGLGVA